MLAEMIRTMYDYSAWANERILDAAERLGAPQYRADEGASFSSIHDTLVHVMGAQWLYLERWQGRSPRAMPEAADFGDLAALRARWREIERDTQHVLAGLSDDDLGRVVAYVNTEGETWAYPLWQQMLHQVNHATQHRSEVATVLTRFGHSPGLLDLLYYLDVKAADR